MIVFGLLKLLQVQDLTAIIGRFETDWAELLSLCRVWQNKGKRHTKWCRLWNEVDAANAFPSGSKEGCLLLSTSMEVLLLLVMVELRFRIYNGSRDSACGITYDALVFRINGSKAPVWLDKAESKHAFNRESVTIQSITCFIFFHGAFLHKVIHPPSDFQFQNQNMLQN